jgi:hypothetical protein
LELEDISYIITTVCLSVRPSNDGSVFEWTDGTGPDGRISKRGSSPDSRIPKRVMGITQQGWGGERGAGGEGVGGGPGRVFFF